MWFIFPQISGLGRSAMARRYAIATIDEARAYLRHPVLCSRVHASSEALLVWAGKRSAVEILGPIDAMKLKSSMTLFEAAEDDVNAPFAAVLDRFFAGARDPATIDRLT